MSVGGWYEGTGRPSHEVLLSQHLLEELFFPKELLAYDTCWLSAVPLKYVESAHQHEPMR